MNNLVSIITPVHNNRETLVECVQSVIKQTNSNWELIIVDDASNDDSLEIAIELGKSDSRIKVFSHDLNKGAAESRNLATTKARGQYIAFLDADDIWYPTKLETQLKKLEIADVCFSSYDLMSADGSPKQIKVSALPELTFNKMLKANYIGNLTGIYNADKLGKIYTPNLRKRQDWLLWLEALKRSGKPAIGIHKSLARYRVNNKSLSSKKWELIKYNYLVYRKGLGFDTIRSVVLTLRFLVEHFLVKSKLTEPIS